MKKDGEEGSTPGEQGDVAAQAAAESLEVLVRDMIPWHFTAIHPMKLTSSTWSAS